LARDPTNPRDASRQEDAAADFGAAASDQYPSKYARRPPGPGVAAGRVWRGSAALGTGSLEAAHREGASGWIEVTLDGLAIHLGATKTDQTGEGEILGIPRGANAETCPVRAYTVWLTASGIITGPAFRAIDRHGHLATDAISDKTVATIVKRTVVAGELIGGATPAQAQMTARRFAGHSLRAGLATSAAANDAPGHAIQRQLRHKRFDTTQGYIRSGELFKKNAAGMAGL